MIGITSNYITSCTHDSLGLHKLFLNEDYVSSVVQAGGIPLVLPIIKEPTVIHAYISMINGLLLTGGDDVGSLLYGEQPSPKLGATRPERDQFEIALIHEAIKQKKPILGICRGLQILNVALGGTLYQDIPSEAPGNLLQHRQLSQEHVATHAIDLIPGSKLHAIFQAETLVTNSFHHQAIKKIAPTLKATAFSCDGIIEGVEHLDAKFIVAVQWHPECMVQHHSQMLQLFTHFVEAAL